MAQFLRRLAVYFGLRRDDERLQTVADRSLVPARASLRANGVALLVAAAIATVAVLLAFGRPTLQEFYAGVFLGIVLGAVSYFTQVQKEVPQAPALPTAPESEPVRYRFPPRLLLLTPLFAGLACLAAAWSTELFAPVALVGVAIADLVGAELVRRWEREHERQVLVARGATGDPELYAAIIPAPSVPSR